MTKIIRKSIIYRLGKTYISSTFRKFYGEFIVLGKENIPADEPVIFAPNHTNALMDALAVVSTIPNNRVVVFLARADLFQNKIVASFMNLAKIMPAFRMRDGVENLGRNAQIFERCIEVLDHNQALCIMPEGNQEVERKLRPLAKGIFRIAFAAQKKYGKTKRLKIVPVGLDYGDNIRQGKHLIVRYGKAIEVAEYMEMFEKDAIRTTNLIRNHLKEALCDITLHLDSTLYYDSFEIAVSACTYEYAKKIAKPESTINKYHARLEIGKKLLLLEKNQPEKAAILNQICQQYNELIKQTKLHNCVFSKPVLKTSQALSLLTLMIVTFPLFVIGLATNFLPYFVPVWIRKYIIKVDFKGFYSSIHYALGWFTFPVFYALQLAFLNQLFHMNLWESAIILLSFYPAGKIAYRWYSSSRKLSGRWRYSKLMKTEAAEIKEILSLRKYIIEAIS